MAEEMGAVLSRTSTMRVMISYPVPNGNATMHFTVCLPFGCFLCTQWTDHCIVRQRKNIIGARGSGITDEGAVTF